MTIRAAAALAGLAATGGGARDAAPPAEAPVFADDFESDGGPVYRALPAGPARALEAGQGVGGSRGLRVTYVGGPTGSAVIARTIPLGDAGSEYTLNYDVRFDRDFQFVLGGKLHGLGPARPVTGGEALRPDGWSARVMWRAQGRPVTYTYHQDQRDKYGDDGRSVRPFAFTPGRYQAVSLHVRLNDPAAIPNGFVRLYVDGVLVSAQEGLRLRGSADDATLIRTVLFSTFHGGHDPSWAPRAPDGGYTDVRAWFDNFAVYRGEHIRLRPAA